LIVSIKDFFTATTSTRRELFQQARTNHLTMKRAFIGFAAVAVAVGADAFLMRAPKKDGKKKGGVSQHRAGGSTRMLSVLEAPSEGPTLEQNTGVEAEAAPADIKTSIFAPSVSVEDDADAEEVEYLDRRPSNARGERLSDVLEGNERESGPMSPALSAGEPSRGFSPGSSRSPSDTKLEDMVNGGGSANGAGNKKYIIS